jgi:hypothetical protein
MRKDSFIKVWISPRDVCLLAAIGNGRPPLQCAQSGNGPEDHILAGLHRKQIQTLWNLGGCRDERTGGPLLGPDGRLVCAFPNIIVPAPENLHVLGPKGPRAKHDYDLLMENYNKPREPEVWQEKAEIARKLVSIHDILGRQIIYFDSVLSCMNDRQTEIQKIKNSYTEKAKNLEREMITNIKKGQNVFIDDYREKIENISVEMYEGMMANFEAISKCFNTHLKKELEYYHTQSPPNLERFNRILKLRTVHGERAAEASQPHTTVHGERAAEASQPHTTVHGERAAEASQPRWRFW